MRSGVAIRVLADPTVADELDRNGVEEVELLASPPERRHQTGLFEHLEVLHHAEARHLELAVELGQRAAVPFEQEIQQMPPRGIGERPEDEIVVQRHGV